MMHHSPHKTKVLLIGAMPPPVGGITVHVSRFIQRNSDSNYYDFRVLDLRKRKLFSAIKECGLWETTRFLLTCSIVHIHVCSNVKLLIAAIAKLAGKKTIYTHHDSRVASPFLFKILYKICDKIILVNKHDLAGSEGLALNSRSVYIPAFITPPGGYKLPDELEEKIRKFDTILSTNCFSGEQHNGGHIYGYDIIIDAFKLLAKNYSAGKMLLILADPNASVSKMVAERTGDFNKTSGSEIFYFGKSLDFSELIKKSSAVIRATRTDGDALTVREALYYGIPVIASDCRQRPEGTILFRDESPEDLAVKMTAVCNGEAKPYLSRTDFNDDILSVYESLTERPCLNGRHSLGNQFKCRAGARRSRA